MVNLGALYAVGKGVKRDNRLAYAWLKAALSFGVPAEQHDATVYLLGTTAARLGPNQLARAEGLARKISVAIANRPGTRAGREV
jgi:TPR repeat protein